jgi:hypothetical protein
MANLPAARESVEAAGGGNARRRLRKRFHGSRFPAADRRDREPLPGAEVQFMQGARKIATAKSGSGRELLSSLPPQMSDRTGSSASFGQLEAVSADAPLKPGAESRFDLQLRDTLRISGTLSDSDGQPRRGVKVEA